jgi:hypothetical protein
MVKAVFERSPPRAVHADVRVDPALPRNRNLAARVARHLRGGGERDEVLEAAAVDRQVGDGRLVHERVGLRLRGLDCVGGDVDRLLHVADAERDVGVHTLADVDLDVVGLGAREAARLDRDVVDAGRQQDEAEKSLIPGRGGLRQAGLSVGGPDGRVRDGGPGAVAHGADDLAGARLRLREGGRRSEGEPRGGDEQRAPQAGRGDVHVHMTSLGENELHTWPTRGSGLQAALPSVKP